MKNIDAENLIPQRRQGAKNNKGEQIKVPNTLNFVNSALGRDRMKKKDDLYIAILKHGRDTLETGISHGDLTIRLEKQEYTFPIDNKFWVMPR